MKKIIAVFSIVVLAGVFSAFATPSVETCIKNCCKTEACKSACIEAKCCKEGKTCDITNHKECKHKCCDTEKTTCKVESDKKSCCKTK